MNIQKTEITPLASSVSATPVTNHEVAKQAVRKSSQKSKRGLFVAPGSHHPGRDLVHLVHCWDLLLCCQTFACVFIFSFVLGDGHADLSFNTNCTVLPIWFSQSDNVRPSSNVIMGKIKLNRFFDFLPFLCFKNSTILSPCLMAWIICLNPIAILNRKSLCTSFTFVVYGFSLLRASRLQNPPEYYHNQFIHEIF